MRIDLHMHTKYSPDSLNGLKALVKRCKELGITPAITDHNTMGAHEKLQEMDFEFIPGEEVKTAQGDLIGLYLNEVIVKGTPFLETIDKIKEQGGLAYLPHMYDLRRKGVGDEKLAAKADIIEIYNPRCLSPKFNELAEGFAIRNGKTMAAGSDTHFTFEIGNAYVECEECDVSEPKGLLRALKNAKIIRRGPGAAMYLIRPITKITSIGKKALGLKPSD